MECCGARAWPGPLARPRSQGWTQRVGSCAPRAPPSGKPARPKRGWSGRKGVLDRAVQSFGSDWAWGGRSGPARWPGFSGSWAPARDVAGRGHLPGWLGSDCVGNPCPERRVVARAHCAGERVWNPCWRLGAGHVGGVHQPGGEECAGVWVCLQCGRPVLEAVCTCNEEENNLLGAFQALILTLFTCVKLI